VTFRRRLTLLSGGAVAIAIIVASLLAYFAVRSQLRAEVDRSLRDRVSAIFESGRLPFGGPGGRFAPRVRPGDADAYLQLIGPRGDSVTAPDRFALPVGATAREVAQGGATSKLYDTRAGGDHVRVLVVGIDGGGAVAIGRSLAEVDAVLRRLRLILALVSLGGIALALALGRLVAGRATAPLARLTETAEHVARTRDLARRIEVSSADEIGSLAASFNAMLDALERSVGELEVSVRAQRQLVADASHELRTPITSLRTNAEILRARGAELPDAQRDELLATVLAQSEELTVLMNDVIELARGDQPSEDHEPVRLDEILGEALERAQRHAPGTRFAADLDESVVLGATGRLARAVNNLLDNAVKWNAPGRPVEVTLRAGTLVVRDHGPGIPEDELEKVFDRFFRGAQTRDRTGSGLGLAIVRQVASDHGGSVSAANAPGGGSAFELRLPAHGAPRPERTAPAGLWRTR
jgi:two-component system sensor histidine kinase MprB